MLASPSAQARQGSARAIARIVQPLDSHQLQKIQAFVEDNLSEKLTLAEIAREVHLSASHLAPRFKATTGDSLHHYIVVRRLARARELIEASKWSIAEIAAAVGFTDHSHLTRSYKRHFGVAPVWSRLSSRVPTL
jgi:AraC family transcriptional regulator